MKKINFENSPSINTPLSAENLNLMQNNMEEAGVVVSSTEPTTEEKVWFKNSKNLVNTDLITQNNGLRSSDGSTYSVDTRSATDYIEVKELENYIVSGCSIKATCFYEEKNYHSFISSVNEVYTFNVPSGCKYLRFAFDNTVDYSTIQLEQGTVATEYEPYIDKGICVKKEDGTYEEYIKPQVKVSATEPTNEDVWFKKGKNLFNKDISLAYYTYNASGEIFNSAAGFINQRIDVSGALTFSWSGYTTTPTIRIVEFDENDTFIQRPLISPYNTASPVTVELSENTKYVIISVENNATDNVKDLQIEAGTEATAYQPYIDKEIYVKNANGVFEKFINAEAEESEIDIGSLLTNGWELQWSSQCFKRGNVVHLHLSVKKGNATTILTLPEGYRPSGTLQFPVVAVDKTGILAIKSSGVAELVTSDLVNYGTSAIYSNIIYKV